MYVKPKLTFVSFYFCFFCTFPLLQFAKHIFYFRLQNIYFTSDCKTYILFLSPNEDMQQGNTTVASQPTYDCLWDVFGALVRFIIVPFLRQIQIQIQIQIQNQLKLVLMGCVWRVGSLHYTSVPATNTNTNTNTKST